MKGLKQTAFALPCLIPGTREWNSLAAFLFLSLTFVLPSGYSLGALMLLVGAIINLTRNSWPMLRSREIYVVCAFLAYAVLWIGDGFLRGEGVSDADRPLRFLLAVPVIIALKHRPPCLGSLAAGLIVGSLGAGAIAAYDIYVVGASRAGGFMPINSFGMLSMLFGLLSFVGFRFASWSYKPTGIRGLLLVASLAAFYGSFVSGSRSSWLMLIGLMPVLLWLELKHWQARRLSGAAIMVAIGLALLTTLSVGGAVHDRINKAVTDVSAYLDEGSAEGSIAARFNMWHGGIRLIDEKLWFGWGDYGYQEELVALAQSGIIDPVGRWDRHLHNQVIHVLVTKGLLGIFVWILVSVTPLVGTWARYPTHSISPYSERAKAIYLTRSIGLIATFSVILSGLGRTPFEHHSSVMIFAFGLPILMASERHIAKNPKPI